MEKTIDPRFDFFATLIAINAQHAANLRAAAATTCPRCGHADRTTVGRFCKTGKLNLGDPSS